MYLTNSVISGCTVYNPETGKTGGVYNTEGLSGRDPYDFFMYGATPVLYIENPAAEGEKRLVVFRDSFGSSLIPLMAEGYSHITVADTRYISPVSYTHLQEYGGCGNRRHTFRPCPGGR